MTDARLEEIEARAARPIIFSAEMVRAILDGTKTQTRRIVKPQPVKLANCVDYVAGWLWPPGSSPEDGDGAWWGAEATADAATRCMAHCCPHGAVGDTLWVKESLRHAGKGIAVYEQDGTPAGRNGETVTWPWKMKKLSARFMPRRASRITLEITDVRVQRLQDISHEDALAEGCAGTNWCAKSPYFSGPHTDDGQLPVEEFEQLWNRLNGKTSSPWQKNCWVWALTFKRVAVQELEAREKAKP